MSDNWRRIGGMAALFQALAYLVGFGFMLGVMGPALAGKTSPAEQLHTVLGMAALFKAWNGVIYIAFGAVLVVLVIALHERLAASMIMKIGSSFGLIWAGLVIATGMIANIGLDLVAKLYATNPPQATLAWQTLSAVQDGLGGGVELVGGLWLMLASVAALQAGVYRKGLHYLGIAVGTAGVLTVIPPLKELGAVFGLGQIAWFIWLGVSFLRDTACIPRP